MRPDLVVQTVGQVEDLGFDRGRGEARHLLARLRIVVFRMVLIEIEEKSLAVV